MMGVKEERMRAQSISWGPDELAARLVAAVIS
jgi:hypothetical protein